MIIGTLDIPARSLVHPKTFSVVVMIRLYAQPIHAQGARPYHVQKPDIQGAVMVL
jgi:hypothetical protein